MGSETSTTTNEPSVQSDQNDAEKLISTVSEEKVNDRDTLPQGPSSGRKRVWSDYVPKDAYAIPDTLEGRLSYQLESLNDWLKEKEKLRLTAMLGNLRKSYATAYVNRWVLECNALFRSITRTKTRKERLQSK